MAVIGFLKSLNGLDHENGAHRFPEWPLLILDFFVNISRYRTTQWLKFGPIDVITLLKTTDGSDYDFGAHKSVENYYKKKNLGSDLIRNTVHPPEFTVCLPCNNAV